MCKQYFFSVVLSIVCTRDISCSLTPISRLVCATACLQPPILDSFIVLIFVGIDYILLILFEVQSGLQKFLVAAIVYFPI